MSCACGVQCERPCNAEPGSVCADCLCASPPPPTENAPCAAVIDGERCGEPESEPPHGKMSGHKFVAPTPTVVPTESFVNDVDSFVNTGSTPPTGPHVEVISIGPPDRSLADILRHPPKLTLEPAGEAQSPKRDCNAMEMAQEEFDTFGPPDSVESLAGIIEKAYAAERARERKRCEAQLRKQAAEHERIASACPDIAEPQMIRANCLEAEADAIAKEAERG